jgi:hypothetical protein
LDAAPVFVNLAREPRFARWRPESVYDLVDKLRRRLADRVPGAWTPHWLRHSHATALLVSGVPVHVVSRRLGHADVQTTLNLYAHVTEDAEMRLAAQWKSFTRLAHRGQGADAIESGREQPTLNAAQQPSRHPTRRCARCGTVPAGMRLTYFSGYGARAVPRRIGTAPRATASGPDRTAGPMRKELA